MCKMLQTKIETWRFENLEFVKQSLNLKSEIFFNSKMVELNIKVTVEKLCQ